MGRYGRAGCGSIALAWVMLAVATLPARAQELTARLDRELIRVIAAGASEVDVLVSLRDDPRHEIRSLRGPRQNRALAGWRLLRNARETQAGVQAFALGRARRRVRSHTIANALSTRMAVADVLELAKRPDVRAVWLDQKKRMIQRSPVALDFVPTWLSPQVGPFVTHTYGVLKVKADQVWSTFGVRGAGIRIGNIDTGVDRNHPDLAGKILAFRDFVGGQALSYDDEGHGTHCAGTHSGAETSGEAIGVAPDSKVIVAKFLDSNGGGTGSNALAAMDYVTDPDGNPATDDGAHVVSNSWGQSNVDDFARPAVINWINLGIFPSFAAGNDGDSGAETVGSPGGYPEAFCVGATDANDAIASFSSRGPFRLDGTSYVRPDVTAPGVNVKSAKTGGGYVSQNGTSMACPHVSGVVALMLSYNPELTVAQIKSTLEATAVPLGAPGKDNDYGSGRVDALAALSAVQPLVRVTSPAPGARFAPSANVSISWMLGAADVQDATIVQFVVDASTDSGVTYPISIGTFGGTSRTAAWTTPASLRSGRVRIRVQGLKSGGVIATEDAVDADFSVNRLPVAVAVPPSVLVRPGTSVTLSGTGSDGDGDAISYLWRQAGGTQSVSITNANQPTATVTASSLRGDASLIELGVSDGVETGTALSTIAVNRLPPVSAGSDVRVRPGGIATLAGSGTTDPDGFATTFLWSQLTGPAVTFAPVLAPSFAMPGARGTSATFRLAASDPLETGSDETIVRVNQIPLASTGPVVRVRPNVLARVSSTLSSDPDGDPLTYQWSQLSGPSVSFSAALPNPSFFPPPTRGVSMTFRLLATDGLDSSTATAVVRVNQLPLASAQAPRAVPPGTTFTLTGTAVDPDGDPLAYTWTQVGGPPLAFDTTAARPAVVAPATRGVSMTFELRASDGLESSGSGPQVVRVNSIPVASAGGAQRIAPESTVLLDGSASADGDGDPLSYEWTQISGPAVTFNAGAARPTFRAPAARGQRLTFQVSASDGVDAAQATTTADVNQLAVARVTAPAKVIPGTAVDLDGSESSDPDGDPLTYRWSQLTGPTAGATQTGARTGFTAPAQRGAVLGFELELSDGFETVKRAVDVRVNRLPSAKAGDDRVVPPGPLVLDGAASADADGDPLAYRWRQAAGPPVAVDGGGRTLALDLSGVARGSKLAFGLSVDDGQESAEALVNVRVNQAPVAGPARSLTLVPGTAVSMKPEASDADGDPLTYEWAQLAGPPVTFNAKASELKFTTPAVGKQTLVFQLKASDGVESATSQLTVDLADREYAADAGAAGGCRARRKTDEPGDPTYAVMLALAALSILRRTRSLPRRA